jgi:hypothetical protein
MRRPFIALERHAQRPCKGLENGFALMVRIAAAQVVDVQGDLRVIAKSLEKLVHQVNVELAAEKSITTRDSASSSGT